MPERLLVSTKSFFTGYRGNEQPRKFERLRSGKAAKVIYNTSAEAEQVINRGNIQVFGLFYDVAKPKTAVSNICRMCKKIDCNNKNKCGINRCGMCSENHPTSKCSKTDIKWNHCVTCNEEGHLFNKCPLLEYTSK